MLSSTGGGEDINFLNRVLSSASSASKSSSSSSASSSPSHHHHHHHLHNRQKTMEEVWKEINLASLHDHPPSPMEAGGGLGLNPRARAAAVPPSPTFIFQDFLARPLGKDPPKHRGGEAHASLLFGSPAVPPPVTVLSLNSRPGFDFVENSDPLMNAAAAARSNSSRLQVQSCCSPPNISNVSNNFSRCPFEASALSSSCGKKRVQQSDSSSGDRRHKRMIKNRESAARSRARKQAYTNELELEVAQLVEENARLKRQQEQLCEAAAAVQFSKKRPLQRTSTAPF